MKAKSNLLNFDRAGLTQFFIELGEKPFRAVQALKWMHQAGVNDFAEMSNLSQKLRDQLTAIAEITPPEIALREDASDGTIKWLLRLADGNCIETVYIPEKTRGTLCVSSQVGCVLNCDFCATGKQGFSRNLTVAEIIGQVWVAARALSHDQHTHDHAITNVVMMGMGEPLLNYDAVLPAMRLMLDDDAYGLAKRRVTLSTSGIVPMMYRLAEESEVALAVSLHAPNDLLRDKLVPVNKKYPLKELLTACKQHFKADAKRKITFEYVMLQAINDTEAHAKELIALLRHYGLMGISKINLIPFNTFAHAPYQCSTPEAIARFSEILQAADLFCMVRKPRGREAAAACGQLVGEVRDRSHRRIQWQARIQNIEAA